MTPAGVSGINVCRAAAMVTAALAFMAIAACAGSANADRSPGAAASVPMPTIEDARPRDYPGIHNAVAYFPGYVSGSVPEGAAGFNTLAAMGVKTIISVDGAAPEVEMATVRGMRYLHLPIGYDGFDEERRLQLTRATRDAMRAGPVYIHCHHGKHRSAGAAAAVVVGLGLDTPDRQIERMKVSGTAPSYKGLYAVAADATVVPAAKLDRVPADFPSVSTPDSFVQAMVEIDAAYEHLKEIEKAGWRTPAEHPDLVPAAEAGRLADLLRVVAEGDRSRSEPPDFVTMMRVNGEQSTALEEHLVSNPADSAGLTARLKLIGVSCKECHVKYRD